MPHGWLTPRKTSQQVHEEDILDHQERTKRLPISQPESYDGWLLPGNTISRKVIIPFDINVGQLWYGLSPLRKKKAEEISAHAKYPAIKTYLSVVVYFEK